MATGNAQTAKTKIVLNYEITEADYIAYNLRQVKRQKAPKFVYIIIWLTVLSPLLFIRFIAPAISPQGREASLTDFAILVFGEMFIFFIAIAAASFVMQFLNPFVLRSTIRINRINEGIGKVKLELLEKTIKDTTNNSRITECPYDSIRSIESDKKRLYVYVGGATAYIIPFSTFKSEAKKQQFVDALCGKLHNKQVFQTELKSMSKIMKNQFITHGFLIILAALGVLSCIWAGDVPFEGAQYMRNNVVTDAAYLDGAEQISATRTTTSTDDDISVNLKIQKEQAEKMIENSVLKECVDSSMTFGGFNYVCNDPIWEAPDQAGITYPTDDKNALCTRSWLDLSSLDDIPDHGIDDESTSILCVNSKTGALWYSYHAHSSAGIE